jgi:hypothetical protein
MKLIFPGLWLLLNLTAPIFDAVDLSLTTKTFNGAFKDNSSIFRQPPSPEVDAAWDNVSAEDALLITVSAADITKSGKDPALSVQAPTAWGFGSDQYYAQVEVFHQIHCLNELRKEIHYDYYYGHEAKDELHTSHKDHCIHMLLQTLMCNADVGIVTNNWVHNERLPDPKTRPFPDFNVVKQCRNFDALLGWMRRDGVKDLSSHWPPKYPEGAAIVPGDGYL